MILEVIPAKKGDCLLLHSEVNGGPRLIIIDGGPAGVSKTLIKRLMDIRAERGLADNQPLVIDALVVSHVDDDHINGVIDLLEAMWERHDRDKKPPLFRIDDLWHNSFDAILGNDEASKVVSSAQFGAASTYQEIEDDEEETENGGRRDAALVLASVAQGDQLRILAGDLGIEINRAFGGDLIKTKTGEATRRTVAGIEFTVIGPREPDLEALEKEFDAWLKKHPPQARTAPAFLAGIDDESVANLSSIVLLGRKEGTTILLTGDARSDKVVAGLENCGELASGTGKLDVSVIKMPHHGSIRNIDADFVQRVTSRNYVFSGNGQHGNPDRETFELLFDERATAPMTFFLTYTIAEIDPERRIEFDKARAKRIAKGKPPGPVWSDSAHSLAAILSGPPQGVTVAEPSGTLIQI